MSGPKSHPALRIWRTHPDNVSFAAVPREHSFKYRVAHIWRERHNRDALDAHCVCPPLGLIRFRGQVD